MSISRSAMPVGRPRLIAIILQLDLSELASGFCGKKTQPVKDVSTPENPFPKLTAKKGGHISSSPLAA